MTWATRQDAIAAWVRTRAGVPVVWADQNNRQPERPYASLKVRSVQRRGSLEEQRVFFDAGVVSDVNITPTVENSSDYVVTVDGTDYEITSGGSATATEIVIALAAAINAGSDPVTASNNGDGTMRLRHDVSGTTFVVELSDNLEYANRDIGHEVRLTASGIREFMLGVTVFTDEGLPPNDAMSIAELAHNALGLETVRRALSTAGMAIHDYGPIIDLSEISGSKRIGRATFDVRMSYAANTAERVGFIETAEVSGTVDAGDHDITIDPFTVGS